VTFALSGFATRVQENGTPAIDTSRSAAATTIDQATIDSIPILGRKFEDLLTLTPGVSVVLGSDGDEISCAGQTSPSLPSRSPRSSPAASRPSTAARPAVS
jgi:hypothetical protein